MKNVDMSGLVRGMLIFPLFLRSSGRSLLVGSQSLSTKLFSLMRLKLRERGVSSKSKLCSAR